LALSNAHLDHLLLTAYAGEGTAGSIFKDLLEDDSGDYRFTANALEQAAVGDATAAKQDEILVDLVDIKGTAFSKDTNSLVNCALVGADSDTLETLSDQLDAVPDAAAINAQVDAAIVTYHLDHLLHTAYADEGAAGSIFEDLIVDNAGTYEYTTAALANAPGATGDATEAKQDEILVDLVDIKGTAFSKDTHSLVDLALASSLSTTDGKIDTIDGIVDNILTDTGTTLDTIVDSILEDTGTTLNGLITTVDTVVDLIMDILEGDHEIDDAGSPLLHVIKRKSTSDVLVSKELYELDDTAVDAVTQVISKELEA
jgi:hypothetical protein